jgi:hypothetical protein
MKTKILVIVGILIIALAAMVAPVMALDSGSATIDGNPARIIAVTVTGDITGWNLATIGENTAPSTAKLTVSSNSPGWLVKVSDAMTGKPAGTVGKMVNATSVGAYIPTPLTYLNQALVLSSTSPTGITGATDVTLVGGAGAVIETGASDATGAGTFTDTPITMKQTIGYTDVVLPSTNIYKIVVTFTGTTP